MLCNERYKNRRALPAYSRWSNDVESDCPRCGCARGGPGAPVNRSTLLHDAFDTCHVGLFNAHRHQGATTLHALIIDRGHTRPAAVPLFISAAKAHGPRVMGIVL